MAAYMRACFSRFIVSRPHVTNLRVSRHVKGTQSLFLQRSLTITRPCSSFTNDEDQVIRTKESTHDSQFKKQIGATGSQRIIQLKLITDENVQTHSDICGKIFGKGGENLNRIRLETGQNFKLETGEGCILISLTDAEGLEIVEERMQQEIQRIRNGEQPISRMVLTDKRTRVHQMICRDLIGKGGKNINRLRFENGLNFGLDTSNHPEHVIVYGNDIEEVDKATEKVKEEVKQIRNELTQFFEELVLMYENPQVYDLICGKLIGKGGENIKRLRLETELDFQVDVPRKNVGPIIVYGTDVDVVKKATEKVKEEIQKIRSGILQRFEEQVLTDKDPHVHLQICSKLIGKRGENIKRLRLETELDFQVDVPRGNVGPIIVYGTDVDMVKKATEKVQEEVNRIKNHSSLSFHEKVLTDENEDLHKRICRLIIGKGGENVKRFVSETELDFQLHIPQIYEEANYLLVSGNDAEVVKEAVGKVQQEIERIKAF